MRTKLRTLVPLLVATLTLFSAGGDLPQALAQSTLPLGHPSIGSVPRGPYRPSGPSKYSGAVVETVNSGGYTYVLIDTGTEKVWAAGSQFEVKVGDRVSFGAGMPMTNFHSKTLDRDFEMIYFTGGIRNESREPASAGGITLPEGHPTVGGGKSPTDLDVSGIRKARDGKTIEEIFTDKASLAGKEVQVKVE